jgi:peptidyl-prolyl cis-trans isomerase D
MVKPFEEAAFSMKQGDISEVIESDFGYHIIKLTGIKAPKQRSFDELRSGIEADLKTQHAQRKYAEVAELFTNTVYEQSDSLKPVADKLKLNVKTADNVTRNPIAGTKGVLASEKFLAALFAVDSIAKKHNTEAVETAVSQLAAGRVIVHRPARILPLSEVRSLVREKVIKSKAVTIAKKEGNEKLALLKKDVNSSVLPAAMLVSRDQTQDFPSQIVVAALRVDITAVPAFTGVDLGDKGYAIVRVNKVIPRTESVQTTAQQNRNQYTQWWTAAESQAYYSVLKERLKTEILVSNPVIDVAVPKVVGERTQVVVK